MIRILLLFVFASCNLNTESKKNETNHLKSLTKDVNYFVLNFKTETDTLFIYHHPNSGEEQYSLVYKKDTISKEWCYGGVKDFIIPMDTLDWHNVFLLGTYGGDGCPEVFKILSFKQNKTFYLSELWGNCERIDRIVYTYPVISFYFDTEDKELNRMKAKYDFNSEECSLINK